MADGRRRESRIHAIDQAIAVWRVNEIDLAEFVKTGDVQAAQTKPLLDPQLQANVDAQIKSIFENGGKLIMPKV